MVRFVCHVPVVIVLVIAGIWSGGCGTAVSGPAVVCPEASALYTAMCAALPGVRRYDTAAEAVDRAPEGSGVLVFAGEYPEKTPTISVEVYEAAHEKNLRLYVEFASSIPGLKGGEPVSAGIERGVVTSESFGGTIEPMDILCINGCHYIPFAADKPSIVLAKVAGFDRAVYGLEGTDVHPVLFMHPDREIMVASTALSRCIEGRYMPSDDWMAVWRHILSWTAGYDVSGLQWEPSVRPAYGPDEDLPDSAARSALDKGMDWFYRARLLVGRDWEHRYVDGADDWSDRLGPRPEPTLPSGDGSCGVLEGFSSHIDHEGYQKVRWWRRADCNAEVAGAMALAGSALDNGRYRETGANLADWLVNVSIMTNGDRADASHQAYGLYGWNDVAKYYKELDGFGVYYGDDNARAILGLMAAAGALGEDRWNASILRCICANFRTSGTLGFRESRIDQHNLVENGIAHYRNADTVVYAPHFQCYLWACYLWAYDKTGYAPFLDKSKTAIRMMMDAYPDEWHWTNGIQQERARMLLPLAWLVRVEDTPEHRRWLSDMAREVLDDQDATGAIREEIGANPGKYGPPKTNAEYGSNEASLIHVNGDKAVDLLYTTNFAFIGLHEAYAATGDDVYGDASGRLAKFLVRIQAASDAHPELDGAWFRGFDYGRWEHVASNSDAGWGVWATETGWTQGWIAMVLSMRELGTSLWDVTRESTAGTLFEDIRRDMRMTE